MLNEETGQKNLTGKCIVKISKLKHLQRCMNSFQLEHIKFNRKPQRNQTSNKLTFSMEEVFETPETEDVDMKTTCFTKMIELIANENFGNTFHN